MEHHRDTALLGPHGGNDARTFRDSGPRSDVVHVIAIGADFNDRLPDWREGMDACSRGQGRRSECSITDFRSGIGQRDVVVGVEIAQDGIDEWTGRFP